MSGAVDTKTVEMRFDNQNFESNAKQSISTLEKLKSALKLDGASKGLSDIEKASKKLDFKDLDRSVGGLGKSFSALETIATGVFFRIGQRAADAGLKIVKSLTVDQMVSGWQKYEQETTAVQTIMNNLTEAEGNFVDEAAKMEYVEKQLSKLMWFADETSYGFTDMVTAMSSMKTAGQGLEASVTGVRGIALATAMAGGDAKKGARAMTEFTQAIQRGYVDYRDWQSIMLLGLNTPEFEKLAIDIAQANGLIKEGDVTLQNFATTLKDKWFTNDVMMELFSRYGEAADKIQEYAEKYDISARDAIEELEATDAALADSLAFRAFKAGQEAKTLSEALGSVTDAISTKFTKMYKVIFGNYLEQKELWGNLADQLYDAFVEPYNGVIKILQVWREFRGVSGIEKSGRDFLLSGFQNIMETFITDTEESVSLLTTFRSAFKEAFDLDKDAETLGKRLWDLTKRFAEFTERLKPSAETLEKIKNSFKGLFTLFKIGGKLVSAIVKPFKDLFGKVFKNSLSGVLDLADGFGSLIQRFDQFLDENKVFDAISNGISWGLQKIGEGLDFVSQMLAGVSFKEFFGNLKTKVGSFFTNLDFSGVGSTFSSIISQIKQVRTESLPEKLTPLQNFYIGVTNIFSGMRKFFGLISPSFKFIGEKINNLFESIGEAFANRKASRSVSRFAPIWEGIKSVFSGLGDFFEKIGPTLGKIGSWIGEYLGKIGEGIAKFAENKSAAEILEHLAKGGFFVSLMNLINSIAGINWGRKGLLDNIAEDLGEIGGVLKAYQREINVSTLLEVAMAIGVLSGSMWILAQIPSDRIRQVGKALGQLALVIAGFSALTNIFKLITSVVKKTEGLDPNTMFGKIKGIFTGIVSASIFANDASAKFLKASAAVALLAVGFKVFSKNLKTFTDGVTALGEKYTDKQFQNGLKALGYITAGLAVLSLFNGLGARRAISSLVSVVSFIVLIKTMSTLVNDISAIGENVNFTFFKSGLYMFGLLAGVVTLFTAINGIGKGKILSALGLYISVLAVMKIVDTILKSLIKLSKEGDIAKIKEAGNVVNSISRTILIFLGLFVILDKLSFKKFIGKNSLLTAAAAIVAAAGAMYLIALALEKVAGAGSPAKLSAARKALTGIGTMIAIVLGILGLISGLNIRIGNFGTFASGKFNGALGLPIAALSFVAACAGVYIMAEALSVLGETNINDTNVDHLKSMTTHIAIITGILGLVAGLNIGAYGTIGAAGVFGGFFGTLGVPLAALSFAAACQGVYVMAEALSMLDGVDPGRMNNAEVVIKNLTKSVGWTIGLLGALAGLNVGALAGPVLIGFSGTLGVPLAALSFAAACQGVYVMAEALSMLDGVDSSRLDKSAEVIERVTKTIGIVIGLLGVIGGFTGLGMLVGAVSFDLIVFGISGLVDVLDRFAHVDLSGLKTNLEQVADALKEFFERAGDAIDKALELGKAIVPVALKVGAAFVVLGLGMVTIGAGLLVIGIGLEALGEGASTAADGINDAADGFVKLSKKDLSGIGKNLAIMAAALVGISVAGLVAAPGLLAIGFAIEAVLGPISRAIDAIGDLLTAIKKLKNGDGSSSGSMPGINVAGSLLPGWLGWLGGLAENIWRASRDSKEAAESVGPATETGIKTGMDKVANSIKAQGTVVDEKIAEGIDSGSSMVESSAYKQCQNALDQAKSPELLSQASENGWGLLAAVLGIGGSGGGFMSLDALGIGGMKVSELLSGVEGGKGKSSALGSLLASVFGDSYSSYDWAGMAGKSLDEVVVALSNGKIDIATAGDLLTSVLGDKWRDYKWEDLTINDIIKVMSASMKDGAPELEGAAKKASTSAADAMEDEEYYSGIGGKNIHGYAASLSDGLSLVIPASQRIKSAVEKPLTSMNSYGWGSDLVSQYASGIDAGSYLVSAAASMVASIVSSFLHFSEPDVGPLSNFHTYAPDMIKLWCSGIYSNLDKVENSSDAMADTVYDGFSTALEYVSDLIDNGMSDELSIRPVMDLSGIQNGIHNMDSLINGANGYTISGSTRLASTAAYGMSTRMPTAAEQAPATVGSGVNNYNTFNITNDDPNAVAQKVSRILDQGARREQAVWAR